MSQKTVYRILLIDDQETIHEDYRKVLGVRTATSAALSKAAAELFDDDSTSSFDWEGFELDSAYQGQDGFALVQQSIDEGRPYALAFVDIRMPPGWDGIQTVRRIWEIDPEILIVICSAYSDYSWEEMIQQLGRNDRFLILKKPFDNVEVRQCAMALTERWSVSRTDVLTGLLNRRAFEGYAKLEWSRATRHDLPLAYAMIDLDYFKQVNDTLGHHAGDVVLRTIAERLRENCRGSDYVCRFGGDELCVLLPHTSEEGAANWAEIARQTITAVPVMVGDQAVKVTASVGTAARLEGVDALEQLIDRADQALLVAKKLGRNRVMRFSAMSGSNEAMHDELRYRASLFQGVTAKDVMTTPAASLSMDATAGEAAELFIRLRINSAPVVGSQGELIGILSEKDVIGMLLCQDGWNAPIDRIMQHNVVGYEEQAPVQSICEFLGRVASRKIIIVRDGRPTGIVSRGDLLRWYSNRLRTHEDHDGTQRKSCQTLSRLRLVQGAQAVARCAVELAENVSTQADELAPSIIERASRLQELVQDLLGGSADNGPLVVGDAAFEQTTGLLNGQSVSVG